MHHVATETPFSRWLTSFLAAASLTQRQFSQLFNELDLCHGSMEPNVSKWIRGLCVPNQEKFLEVVQVVEYVVTQATDEGTTLRLREFQQALLNNNSVADLPTLRRTSEMQQPPSFASLPALLKILRGDEKRCVITFVLGSGLNRPRSRTPDMAEGIELASMTCAFYGRLSAEKILIEARSLPDIEVSTKWHAPYHMVVVGGCLTNVITQHTLEELHNNGTRMLKADTERDVLERWLPESALLQHMGYLIITPNRHWPHKQIILCGGFGPVGTVAACRLLNHCLQGEAHLPSAGYIVCGLPTYGDLMHPSTKEWCLEQELAIARKQRGPRPLSLTRSSYSICAQWNAAQWEVYTPTK
jgi:hypothetical protein